MRLLTLGVFAVSIAGCFSAANEPPVFAYHNPLDVLDAGSSGNALGGVPAPDSGVATQPTGVVDGRQPTFISAIYDVQRTDAGPASVNLFIADVANLCEAADAGMGPSWDLLRLHLSGDEIQTYPVAAVLAPAGAIGEFDFQDDAGGFGIVAASGGSVQIDAIDPDSQQMASGSYSLDFAGPDGGTKSLSGVFTASPCPVVPGKPQNL